MHIFAATFVVMLRAGKSAQLHQRYAEILCVGGRGNFDQLTNYCNLET